MPSASASSDRRSPAQPTPLVRKTSYHRYIPESPIRVSCRQTIMDGGEVRSGAGGETGETRILLALASDSNPAKFGIIIHSGGRRGGPFAKRGGRGGDRRQGRPRRLEARPRRTLAGRSERRPRFERQGNESARNWLRCR